ncbi:MAG: LuxR C-terminal-related transcriptional regulator [Acidimicrobiia bacterium]
MAGPPSDVQRVVEPIVGDDGTPAAGVIVGPGGYGKSEVLDAVAAVLEDRDVVVTRVTARRLEHDVPFAAIEALLDGDAPKPGGAGERRARAAVGERLGAGALVVDDAQWLDPSSLHVLVAVAERSREQGAGVVVAHRPSTASQELAALDSVVARHGPLLWLPPLTDADVGERAARALDAPVDDELVDALMVRTEGVVLFVDELVRAWAAAGVLERGAFREPPGPVPAPLVERVRAVSGNLGEPARRALGALSLGSALDDELLVALADLEPGALAAVVDELRATGLLVPGHDELLPIVAEAVADAMPTTERRRLHTRLATALVDRGDPPGRAAEHLVAGGAVGPEAVTTLVAAGNAALAETPALAREWLERALEAGADAATIAAYRGEAAALTGDLDSAVELADTALAEGDPSHRARATAVLAGVLGSRGLWGRSAQLFGAVRDHPDTPDAVFRLLAVPGLVALGRVTDARAALAEAEDELERPARLAVEAIVALAASAVRSVDGSLGDALAGFVESAELLEASTGRLVLPDTPHALGAVVAAAACDFTLAEHLLARAVEHEVGGPGLAARHHLLVGWVAMRAGHWTQAELTLDEIKPEGLATREQLLRAALDAGLARRRGDLARLGGVWERAEPALLRAQADLFALEPLAELATSAVRLQSGGSAAVAKLAEVARIVAELGNPPLWTLALRWAALETAVAADDAAAVTRCAAALEATTPAHERLAGLAPAARAWRDLLGGEVDPDSVDTATAGLAAAGLSWEASRLTGQAAIRTTDRSVTRALLGRARDLKESIPAREGGGPSRTVEALSEREQEVAAYVLDGLTHKEIGAQLFISPKTVEHHVAKIRQKVGATTRAEMLAALRAQTAAPS